jgi:hypothetical protein
MTYDKAKPRVALMDLELRKSEKVRLAETGEIPL